MAPWHVGGDPPERSDSQRLQYVDESKRAKPHTPHTSHTSHTWRTHTSAGSHGAPGFFLFIDLIDECDVGIAVIAPRLMQRGQTFGPYAMWHTVRVLYHPTR